MSNGLRPSAGRCDETPRPWSTSTGQPSAEHARKASHAVQFYEDHAFLVEVGAKLVAEGLAAGDWVLVFATNAHWTAFSQRLQADGWDVDRPSANGQLTVVDAGDALSQFMENGMPDRERFLELVGRLFEARGSQYERAPVRAYGEMVDVLLRQGNARAALRLEELWNEVGAMRPMALLCAYGMGNFDSAADTARFLAVCNEHGHVHPDESFPHTAEVQAQLREISVLQQRARALEDEILQRKEMEQTLREALRERKRAEEEARALNELKDEFLATVSHELRTPLNAILGWAVMLRSDPHVDAAKAVETIERNARAQGRLIEDVLDVSRIITGKLRVEPTAIELAAVLRASLDVITPAAVAKGVALHVTFDCDPCPARADGDRVQQIFWNLLSNAVKFTPRGGRVDARLAVEGTEAVLTVRDTGRGIEKAFLPFLFERFRQADSTSTRAERGLGLGLAIVRHLVELHGGTVTADSAGPGQGATFRVCLPIRAAPRGVPRSRR
jgi:signal transduction histidine kinase